MQDVKRSRVLLAGAVLIIVVIVAAAVASARLGPYVRAKAVQSLESRMAATVAFDTFEVSLLPRPRVSGSGLTIRNRERPELPPLITVSHFTGEAGWLAFIRKGPDWTHLEGLTITIPPRRGADMPRPIEQPVSAEAKKDEKPGEQPSGFSIGLLTASNARLTILPRDPGKEPKVWDIFALEMYDLTLTRPSAFRASLTNPVPEGLIETDGQFGPWNRDEAGDTPVSGQFQFDADLGTIKGIAGALTSEGVYDGVIQRITARGQTSTPAFSIPKLKAAPLPLATAFNAVIDGTSGDVQLESVNATLGTSVFLAKGFIVGTKGIKGKRVLLDVTADRASMEDILTLTVRGSPPAVSGRVKLATSFDLPQGDRDVVDKLRLAGTATISNARFSKDAVQDKVDALSRRAQGRPTDDGVDNVASVIETKFAMADGAIRLERLGYTVDGARVDLAGTFALESRALDLAGTVRLDATVSETQTGFKHFVLKPFDWMFRKGGAGTRLAITVGGTAEEPKFGVNMGRTLKGQ